MVSDYREIRPHGSPHIPQSPSFGYFAEQARFGGYMGPELGRTQRQHFRGDHHQQSPHPHPRPHPHAHLHPYPRPFPVPYAHDMHEAIQREIEKEQIREEIIMSEIVRRRELEAEVRRELMMERELALRRGSNGFPFGSPSVVGFDSPMRLPLMETRVEGRSLEERIMMSLADRERLNGRRESGGLEHLPFQRGSADVRISEVKPVTEGRKEKEKIILLAKLNENISGKKREASTVDASESPSDGNVRKKSKEEWSCALCQVSATSEGALNEHVQGKKHKAKEAALRAQKGGKNYSIGLFPKKATKAITVDPATDKEARVTYESLPLDKTGEASTKTDDLSLLQENLNADNLKKNEESVAAKKVQKDKKKYRFWCELCQVGVPSQKVLNNHQNGKKHKHRLYKSNKKCVVGRSDEKDGAVNEKSAEDGGAMGEPVEEVTVAEVGGAVDVIKPDDDLTKADVADELKDDELPVS